MTSEIVLGEGGGGTFSCTPDKTRELGSITSIGGSYTTTEDCVMCCIITGGSYWAQIFLGTETMDNLILTTNSTARIGMDGNGVTMDVGFPIPKGSTVRARSDGTGHSYNVKFYAMQR